MIDPKVVAVDGPSGSGKSSVSKGVARVFGFEYLDTGAMYRAATWQVLHEGVDLGDPVAIASAATAVTIISGTDPDAATIHVGDTDVSDPIREGDVTAAVSAVSAVPAVRMFMLGLQRSVVAASVARGNGIVVEGRDIGTEVLPDADAKIYLTADPAVRAARRAAEDSQAERGGSDVAATEQALRDRDVLDTTRTASPLRMADDAVLVDASELDLEETIQAVCDVVRNARTV